MIILRSTKQALRTSVGPGFCIILAVQLIATAALMPTMQAADRFWVTPGGGSFGTPGVASVNWSATDGGAGNATAPTTTDVANFTLGNTYDVTFSGPITNTDLDIEDGNVTFDLNDHIYRATSLTAIEIGKISGQTGRLTLIDGTLSVDTQADDVQIGVVDGSAGFLTVSTGGRLGIDGTGPDTFVGHSGAGTLTVQSDGEVFTIFLTVGFQIGSTGTVTVTGPQASLDASGTLTIGDAGAGTMTITSGAEFVGAGTATLGLTSGSMGTLTITGDGSTWTQLAQMTVGSNGVGTLNIQSSGFLTTTGATSIGSGAGGFGTATISSGGSASTQAITVGGSGNGTLTVTGAGSSLATNGQSFTVGSSAGSEGDATISGGGTIATGGTTLGTFANSHGSLAVSGSTSSFTSSSGTFLIGSAGSGSLEISSGGTVSSVSARIAFSAGSTGNVTVSGTGSTWNAGSLSVGGQLGANGGTGTLTIDSGGMVNVSTTTEVRSSAGSTLTIDGGTLRTENFTRLGTFNFRDGTLHVRGIYDHGAAAAPLVIDGATAADLPTLRLSGNFAVQDVTTITVGNNNQGALVLDSARGIETVVNDISIGAGPLSSGTVSLNFASLVTFGALSVGGTSTALGGTGVLNLGNGSLVSATTLNLYNDGLININGGTLSFFTFNATAAGRVSFNSGAVQVSGPSLTASHLDALLGPGHVLGSGRRLESFSNLSLNAPLTVNGGTVSNLGGTLTNLSTLQVIDGSVATGTFINATGRLLVLSGLGALSANIGITNNGTFQLDNNLVPTSGAMLTNNGTIRGSGLIGNNLTNNPAGQVRLASGDRLVIQGPSPTNTNSGSISLSGGELVVIESLVNSAGTGLITVGDAILRLNGGITNNGSLAVPFGRGQLFGDINNTGSLVVSGGAAAVFYDDITQNGTFRVSKVGSTTSVAVVFGDFTGTGGSTGGGDIFFEGDLRPGNSPATVEFDNNIAFGSGATLEIELGGTSAGAQYDQVHVAGDLSLDGTLQVELINGFTPSAGNSFDILDWASLHGMFNTLQLPALSAGLGWNTSQLYSNGVLSIASASLSGDYNENGIVDAADFVLWRKNLGSGTSLPNDDTPGVGPDDYTRWRANFGQSASRGAGVNVNAAVPESASLALFFVGMLAICNFRRATVS